jgi:two-component system, OmpR family, sensor histidine kinase VicK
LISNAKYKIDVCVDNAWTYLAIEMKLLRDALLDAKRRGIQIRYITEIKKDNLCYCKELLSMVEELRHLNGIKGNFYISEGEYIAPATTYEGEKFAESTIYSSVKEIREHQQYIFDSFWNVSTFAERKMKEIQDDKGDIALGTTEIIGNPLRIKELFINLIKSAKTEVLLILPTVNAFIREYKMGIIQLLKELSTTSEGKSVALPLTSISTDDQGKQVERKKQGVTSRILTPTDSHVDKIIDQMGIMINDSMTSREESISYPSDKNNAILQIRSLESLPRYNVTTVTILVVDRKESLVMEKKDDSKEDFIEAVGLSTYSTSEPTVMSYVSIFENFWNQLELYQRLKEHDKMQKEFINIAAHELRTPVQSIAGYSELLEKSLSLNKTIDDQHEQMLHSVYRNASRLRRITENILDASRIESKILRLNKERFDINEKIKNVVNDIKEHTKLSERIEIIVTKPEVHPIIVEADKTRIYEVISNLLVNAIKFTKKRSSSSDRNDCSIDEKSNNKNTITISTIVRSNQDAKTDNNSNEVIINIEDRGTGINPEIMPRLFSKFASMSSEGTGLGLFISKSIVEAHGGKIWAQNNRDGGGATFSFSLPLIK